MKLCLLSKIPFILGIAIYDSFFVNKNPANGVPVGGIITTPNKTTDTQIGGHAVVCVGYKDSTNHFIIRNSWGFNSGDGGYLYLPYDYITNTEFTSDIWIITKML
jgi:C1A family cysteine protease